MSEQDDSGNVPLYLCCAEESEVALITLIDELHRDGVTPEVLSNVDGDPSGFVAAVDGSSFGLFVLCQSDDLDRGKARRLRGLFSARKGPAQRMIVVTIPDGDALVALPEIRAALSGIRDAHERLEQVGDAGARRGLLRDVVGTTKVSAVRGRASATYEELARRMQDEMTAAQALIERPRTGKFERRRSEVGAPTGAVAERDVARKIRAVDEEVDAAETHPDGHRVGSGEDQEPTGPLPVAPSRPTERSTTRFVLAAALVGMASLTVMAVVYLVGEPARGGAGSGEAQAGIGVPRGALKRIENPPVASSSPAPRAPLHPAQDPAQAAASPTARRDLPEATSSDVPPPPPTPEKPLRRSPTDEPEVARALSRGLLRSFGSVVYTRPHSESVPWASADRACRTMEVGGVDGFRLPSKHQLQSLARSGLQGVHWTHVRTEHEDEAFAFDPAKSDFNVYLLVEPAARVVCVRGRS